MSRGRRPHNSRATRDALVFALAILFVAVACAGRKPTARRPPPSSPTTPTPAPTPTPLPPRTEPGSYLEEGLASWYGVPYHGRKTSNGEVYDMHKMTAAHRTLPFDSVVRVVNTRNGRKTQVRINDRGPFVEGRIIDLSLAAAREIDMVASGTAPVRLELVSGPHLTAGQFTVQVGAFREEANATRLRQRLERRYQPVLVVEYDSPQSGLLYRVRVGRVPTEEAARKLAERLQRDDQLSTFVVRLDE
jgi:rare lipoprotein A